MGEVCDNQDNSINWSELWDKESEPSGSQIKEFIDTCLWDDLGNYLQQEYNVKPKLSYSGCSMDKGNWKGWNVKYKKSSKALCTLYPKRGYFLALLPIGLREMGEAEILISTCTEYTQNLFAQTVSGRNGKSLAFEVKSEDVLLDMKKLIAIRVASR